MTNSGDKNGPKVFYYVCGDFVIKIHQRNMTCLKKSNFTYFGVNLEIGNQDKCSVVQKIYYDCTDDVRKWFKKAKETF